MPFDPDKYLEDKQKEAIPEFNPDSYLSGKEPQDLPSKGRSAWLGGLQGASLGTADEIEAALKTLPSIPKALSKDDVVKNLLEEYRKNRGDVRKEYATAQQTNPISYGAGMLAGGAATGLATAGLAPEALAGIRGTTLLGGAAGLGSSEADLTSGKPQDYVNAAKDTAMGAGTGAILGQAGKTIGEANPIQNFKAGLNGTLNVGAKGLENATQGVVNAAEAAGNTSEGLLGQARQAYQKLNDASVGKPIDLSDEVATIGDGINKIPVQADADRIQEILSKFNGGKQLSLEEAQLLKNELGNLGSKLESVTGKQVANQAAKTLKQGMEEQVPGLSELNSKYKALNTFGDVASGGSSDLQSQKLFSMIVEKSQKEGISAAIADKQVQEAFDALKSVDPEKAAALEDQVMGAIKNYNLAKSANAFGNSNVLKPSTYYKAASSLGNLTGYGLSKVPGSGVLSSIPNATQGAANTLTTLAPHVNPIATRENPTTNTYTPAPTSVASTNKDDSRLATQSRSLYDASDSELKQVAETLKTTNPAMASSLSNAIDGKDTDQKNAILFSIAQSPNLRKLIHGSDNE